MKIRLFAALMIALMAITILAGCQASANTIPSQRPAESIPEAVPTTAAPVVAEPLPTQAAPTRITAEEAEAIALSHAGIAAEQVSYMRTEFDYDDGRPEYDIEFYSDGWEYDYEIHAETGEILSWDKDRDD